MQNTISTTIYSSNDKVKETIVYRFLDVNTLEKLSHIQTIDSNENENSIATQLYPLPIDKFPLLDPNLPEIVLKQGKKTYTLSTTKNTVITLKKAPFSIEYIAYPFNKAFNYYTTKFAATFDKNISDSAQNNTLIENIPFFKLYSAIAVSKEPSYSMYIDDDGHNVLANSDEFKTSHLKKHIDDTLTQYEYTVKTIDEKPLNSELSLESDTLHFNISTDKNLNTRIEAGELYKATLIFKP